VQFKLNFLDSLRFLISGREKLSFGGNTKKKMCGRASRFSNCQIVLLTTVFMFYVMFSFLFGLFFSKFAKNNLSSYMRR
jgi:hypothetical protein